MASPDFVGVGSHKAGTTWWYHSLVCHPQIRAATVPGYEYNTNDFVGKQLHFFDRYHHDPFDAAEAREEYGKFFKRPCGEICGEWTPRYATQWWVPSLLRQCVDEDTKILMTVRDPVVRYESSHAHHIRHNMREFDLKFNQKAPLWAEEAFSWGLYGQHLERLLKWFDPENVLVLQYEKMVREPEKQYGRTLEFLGVDPSFLPADLYNRYNASRGGEIYKISDTVRDVLKSAYVEDVALLVSLAPDVDTTLWTGER